jgi:RimJ/RimL family protein N-acetyltransferase
MIETERLLLRRLVPDDIDELVAIHAELEVERFMGEFDRPRVIAWLEANRRDWDEVGYGRLAVVERRSGRFLGRSGPKYLADYDETEIGWLLAPAAWGRGFATEAGRASVAWACEHLDVPYVTAMIRPDNRRSISVAERLGMQPRREDVLLDEQVVVYGVDLPRSRCS